MFDINARIGQWPYRPVATLDDMLRTMDEHGIERAAVSSLNAVHYFNPHDGNEELHRAVVKHGDRLIPMAVLRPNLAGWKDDLKQCFDEFGMRGLVLYPNYHRFSLSDAENPSLLTLVDLCLTKKAILFVQIGLEDPRRQFRRLIVEDTPPEDVAVFSGRHPDLPVVALGLKYDQAEQIQAPWPVNLRFDTSTYERLGELEHAVSAFGEDRILFGTNAPLLHPRANVDKLQCADLKAAQREAVAFRNAASLFSP